MEDTNTQGAAVVDETTVAEETTEGMEETQETTPEATPAEEVAAE